MNTALTKNWTLDRIALVDILFVAIACLIPTMSHLFAFPFYRLNPMLMVLLCGRLVVGNRPNAYLLAVLMPVVSSLVVGLPVMTKAFCMVFEYLSVLVVFDRLSSKTHDFVALVCAVLFSKVVYYSLFALVG